MAWGYWTAYTAPYAVQNRRQRTLSPPNKRDRSLERERDRISLAATAAAPDCVSRTSVTYVSGSGTGSGRDNEGGIMASAVRNHPGIGKHMPPHHLEGNHVEPGKVAYERRLLLGDPDWANRTLADRNTLPRKKQPEYDKSSGSEALYSGGEGSSEQPHGVPMGDYIIQSPHSNRSPPTTPLDSGSHKSDEIFCPACAHQSSQAASSSRGDINSNRDSRVSFGSVASSSRGSRGSGSGRGGGSAIGNQHRGVHHLEGSGYTRDTIPISIPPPPHPSTSSSTHHHLSMRARSRSQDDDDRCSSRGGLSSSLPTPPPPPTYSSQRDILNSSNQLGNDFERIPPSSQSAGQGTATALMETINKKMSFLSKFKSPPQSQEQPYPASNRTTHTPNQYQQDARISSQKYHTMSTTTGDGHNTREPRNYYQHSQTLVGAPSHTYRQRYDDSSQQPASILVQAATAAALNHYPTSTSSNRSIQKSSNTSSIEKAAGSSASRDHSSSSLHSLRGGGIELGDIHSMNSPILMATNVSTKPALPPKPQKTISDGLISTQISGPTDSSKTRHLHPIAGDVSTGTVDRRRNQQQPYYQKELENRNSSYQSHNHHHQRSFSAGRRSAHSHSRSGSRTPHGSSSRTSRESIDHNKRSRESLSASRERTSILVGHGEAKYSRIVRGRRGSKEQLEDADADGDEESEGGNTNTISTRNGNRNVKNSIPLIHSEHRVRVTQHHQHSSSHHSGGGGSSSSAHGRSSKESGSIVGIRNRKSSSVDEVTCGDATIHRGEYDDDVISTTSSSVKRRKSHGGAFISVSSTSKTRGSNDGDNENDVEDEDDEEDEDNRGTMRRRRIRTISASDHSEVSGTRPASYKPSDRKTNTRDRLSSGERGDADDDDDDDPSQKGCNVNKIILVSTPQDTSLNTTSRSQRSSPSQTPDNDEDVKLVGDLNSMHRKDKKDNVSDNGQHSEPSQDRRKRLLANDETLSRSLSECDEHKGQYNPSTMRRNVRKGSLNSDENDRGNRPKPPNVVGIEKPSGAYKKEPHSVEVPFTTSPPSFSKSGIQDQDILNNPFSFGRPSHSSQNQLHSQGTRTQIPRSSMDNSKTNVQYFKHYDHREELQEQHSENIRTDQHYPYPSQSKNQQPFDFKAMTSTTPASRRDFSEHTNRRCEDRQLNLDHRRRSASIGDRLSDVDNMDDAYRSHNRNVEGNYGGNNSHVRSTYREDSVGYRKSHTLDDRRTRRGNNDCNRGGCTLPNQSLSQHNHQTPPSMGSFQNVIPPNNSRAAYSSSSGGFSSTKKYHRQQPSANSSTKSEKSSSRSSQSPSIDSNRYGKYRPYFQKCSQK